MLSHSKTLSPSVVVKAADAFVSQAQSIATSVHNWAQAAFSKGSFLESVGALAAKVEDIGQKVRKVQGMGSVESAHVRRLCEEVRIGLASAYLAVEQNAQIQDSADESFFFDLLKQLEQGWCSHDAPLHAHYTQAHSPVAPSDIEALDNFLQTLGKYSDTFGNYAVSCFISYAQADGPSFAAMLCKHLKAAGVDVKIHDDLGPRIGRQHDAVEQAVQNADYVIVLGSKAYGELARSAQSLVRREQSLILERDPVRVLRALVGGTILRSFPPGMNHRRTGYADFRQASNYHSQTLALLERIYSEAPLHIASSSVPKTHPIEARLRNAYARRSDFRRFMGDEAKLESAYVVPDIIGSLQVQDRVRLVGNPGAGKSTLCHYIAHLYGTSQEDQLGEWAQDCSGIIWIPLKELLLYDKNDISLAGLVADLWFDGKIVNGLVQWLQSPNLIYLLDGEDEVHHLLDERSSRGRLLNQLFNKPRSIITSRADERCPQTTMKVELPLLDDAAVEIFVNRYFADAGMSEQAPLFLESAPHAMRELMKVPFTLELLCHHWFESGHHSAAPIYLYQRILADLCRLKAEKLGEDLSSWTDDEVEAKFPALPYLFEIAFQVKMQGKEGLIAPALYTPILEQVERSKRLLIYEQLFSDETFMRRVGHPSRYTKQTYVFHHAVFMDYCAARHLAPLLVANGGDLESLMGGWSISKNLSYWFQTALFAKALYFATDPGRSPLQRAAAIGDFKEVKLLLDAGASVDQTTKNRETPLHSAIVCGQVEVAKLLLKEGASINQADKNGVTPLHSAIVCGQVEVVQLLLKRGALIDQADWNGPTPLHSAAVGGHVEVAKFLLDRGAWVDQADENGVTPLHSAAHAGHFEVVQLLLERGASIDQANRGGIAPLHSAAHAGHLEVVQLLLERGALIDQAGWNGPTPLHSAAVGGHVEVAKLLLKNGAWIDQANKKGETPLYLAVALGHVEVTQLLLDAGASIDQADWGEPTPLHNAAHAGHVEVTQLLLDAGASIDQADRNEMTPLHFAAYGGHVEVTQLLLDAGASIDQADRNEMTPLQLATIMGHVEIAELLRDRRASVD